jgi:PAS domain-containing protein
MLPILRTRLAGYLFVATVIVLATFLTGWSEGVVTRVPRSYYIAAVALSAWSGGLWFGLVSTALSAILLNYWVAKSENAPLFSASHLPVLLNFLAVSIIISILLEVQRQAALKMERQRTQAEVALNSIDDMFFCVDPEWRLTYINAKARQASPFLLEDAVGQVLWNVFPKLVGTKTEEHYRYAMEKRVPVRFVSDSPYSTRIYNVVVYPAAEGISVLSQDITESYPQEHTFLKSNTKVDVVGTHGIEYSAF